MVIMHSCNIIVSECALLGHDFHSYLVFLFHSNVVHIFTFKLFLIVLKLLIYICVWTNIRLIIAREYPQRSRTKKCHRNSWISHQKCVESNPAIILYVESSINSLSCASQFDLFRHRIISYCIFSYCNLLHIFVFNIHKFFCFYCFYLAGALDLHWMWIP